MDYLGLFCLGAFVGAIATVGLQFVTAVEQWQKVLALILPAVLSGVAVVFVDKFKYSPALGCYPLGLLVSLLWAYSGRAVTNINSPDIKKIRLGYAHLLAAILITLVATIAVTIPACRQLVDEIRRPPGDTLEEYKREQMRDQARAAESQQPPQKAPTSGAKR